MKSTLDKIVIIQQKLVQNYNDIQTKLNDVSYTDKQYSDTHQRLDGLMDDLGIEYAE